MSEKPALELLLVNIQSQLEKVEDKLNKAASLNGGFEKLVEKVDQMQIDFAAVRGLLLGDGEKLGVVTRLREVEMANIERNRYIEQTVEPAFKQHQRMVFQMERFEVLLERDERQTKELTLLKERVGLLNKVMWLFGTGIAGLLLNAAFSVLVP